MTERRVDPSDWEEAIADSDGPQLVVGGPGTGKTEFLVRRAVHLVNGGLRADRLLVLTFSRRAAAELRSRIEESIARSTTAVPASTFHSFAHRILEAYTPHGCMPALLTGPEQVALVGELLRRSDPEPWPAAFRGLLGSRAFAEEVADFLMRCQERLLAPADLAELASGRDDWRNLPDFLASYQSELAARGRIDYGTLQVQAVRILEDPSVRTEIGERHRYVLVDEYQDTTVAQSRLLELLFQPHGNLTAAADPYQSVYGFRGAELANVAEFTDRFSRPDRGLAVRIVLTTSFRVPAEILSAAERVTAHGDLPGSAGPVAPADHQGRVEGYVFDQQSHEAEWLAGEIGRLHVQEGIPYRSIAVLVRTKRRLLPELSRALERLSIPHDPPDARLADHPAVRLVFDCVELAEDLDSPDAAATVRRLLLGPLFSLPVGRERELARERIRRGWSWTDLFREGVPSGAEIALLLSDPAWATHLPAAEGFWHLWNSLPQFEPLVESSQHEEFRIAWSSLSQALARQTERDPELSLAGYRRLTEEEDFEATPLLSYRSEPADRLTLTTLHQAKGLEFEAVFIPDASEGVFPDLRRGGSLLQPRLLSPDQPINPAQAALFRLREEMRLAYSAMTRARSRVVWTATSAGLEEAGGRPSRFLLAAAGVDRVEDLPGLPARPERPVTHAEAESWLRRTLTDPAQPAGRRLAAARLLVDRPNPGVRPVEAFGGFRPRGPDVGLLPEELTLSPSQADAYQGCPRRYAFERRLGVGDTASRYADFGSLVHQVLEAAEREALQDGSTHASLEDALAHLDATWVEGSFGGGAWEAAWRRRARKLLTTLYQRWPGEGRPVEVEHPLSMDSAGIQWMGRADRIDRLDDGTLRIIDYKTSKSPHRLKDAASSLQLGFYLLAASRDPNLRRHGRPASAEFWFPLAGEQTVRRRFDPASLPLIEAALEEVAGGIEAEDWRPRVSADCRTCAVRLVCPEWPEGREAFAS